MMISGSFDQANKERRKRINNTALQTAEKLNKRMHHFLNDVNSNYSLTNEQKNKIRKLLLKDLGL